MTKRFTSTGVFTFISHPLVLSLVTLLLTVLIVPKEFRKHNLELIHSWHYGDTYRNYEYRDINNDGINEKLQMRNLDAKASIVAFTPYESIYEAWSLPGFWHTVPDYSFGDIDKDGIEEMYCISIIPGDSVLVSQIELSSEPESVRTRTICKLSRHNDALDHMIKARGLIDVTGDSIPDFIFLISAGFSLQPRAYFAWDLKKDSIIRTPFAGMNFRDILMETSMDYTQKRGVRIFSNVNAPQNYASPVRYSDTAAYAVVFTENLDYLFEPVYTGGGQTNTTTFPFRWQDKEQILAVTYDKRKTSGKTSLQVFDNKGKLLRKNEGIELNDRLVPVLMNGQVLLHQSNDREFSINEIGPDLHVSEIAKFNGSFAPLMALDVDADLNEELILIDSQGQAIAILDDDLHSLTTIGLPEKLAPPSSVSIKTMDHNSCEIFIQILGSSYLLDYSLNSFYPFRWTYYILLYLMYALVFVGLQKLFVFRNKKKKEIEDKIINLQLQSVMNQLNPHFTFNAINSIGLAMMEGKSMEAYEYFVSLSELIRKTMKNAFEPYKTLAEEIEFVKQYLHIESYRFNGKLSWNFQQDPTVNVELIVPKMLIHIFVENAIKHGVFHNPEGGKIDIAINKSSIGLLIMITDDGVGMSKAFEIEKHRGDGLRILDNYLVLFNRQNKHSVSYNISDCTNLKAGQTGTRILITIKI